MMGNFKKLTTMAVGMYSNFLDYSSLQNGSKLVNIIFILGLRIKLS